MTVFVVAGCAGDPVGMDSGGTHSGAGSVLIDAALVGAYRLTAVGGASLPAGYDILGPPPDLFVAQRIRYLSGSLTLRETGEWSLRQERRVTRHGGDDRVTVETMEGFWTVSGSTVTLTRTLGTTLTADHAPGVLTITDPDLPVRFTWTR